MRRFLIHITFFLLPVILLLGFIWSKPAAIDQRWNRLIENCSKSSCVYNLTQEAVNIDVAFVVTSRTMAAVVDSMLSKSWNCRVANLGYCRPGRNVQYEILKLLFAKHKPKVVFIQISQDEEWYGHFDYGNVASTRNVLHSVKDGNPKFARDLVNNFVMKFDLFQRQNIFQSPYKNFSCEWGNWPAGPNQEDFNSVAFVDPNSPSQRYTSELYLKRMISLCQENGSKVVFHYLPTFGLSGQEPHYAPFYENVGPVILDPVQFVEKKYWVDASHMNAEAALIYSRYLADTCKNLVVLK